MASTETNEPAHAALVLLLTFGLFALLAAGGWYWDQSGKVADFNATGPVVLAIAGAFLVLLGVIVWTGQQRRPPNA